MSLAEDGIIDRENFPAAQQGGQKRAPKGGKVLIDFTKSVNIAEDLESEDLGRFGDRVVKEYEVDKMSRSDWERDMSEALDMAMQVADDKIFPWPGAANIKYPLVTTASIQFNARAYPAIINSRNVVKGQIQGNDDGIPEIDPRTGQPAVDPETGAPIWRVQPGIKQKRADRVSAHMSFQLLDEMKEWEEDTDKLLTILPIIGCCFRKTWFDDAMGRNASQMISPDNLVVNDGTKDLETVPRITQVFKLYPYEITERQRMGLWRDVELGPAQGEAGDDDNPHTFLEQHRMLDLDDDGYPEPYIVTVHKDTSQVMRIVARYDEEGVLFSGDEVAKIEPIHYFTKYGFIPNPSGSFYDIGFGWLLRPMNAAINTIVNQMLDASSLQITGGGFIGDGLRIKGGNMRFRLGEWKRVNSTGGTIQQNVVPLVHPGPSATMFQLLGLLIEAAKDISSVKDIMTGDEGRANEAATAKLARIEQGMKVFSAIYKRVFRSLKGEFGKLYRLNAIYMDDKAYFRLHDTQEAVAREDYQEDDLDVIPAADPNMVSDMQKIGRAQFLSSYQGNPRVEQTELLRRIFEAAGIEDIPDLLEFEPGPDPMIALKADELDIKKKDQEIKYREMLLKGEKTEFEMDKMLADVAKIKSEIILNYAKADDLAEQEEIKKMLGMADNILEAGRLRQENRRLDIEEQKLKGKSDESV